MNWTKKHFHIDLSHAVYQTRDASLPRHFDLWKERKNPAGPVVSAESLSHRSDPHKRVRIGDATAAGGCAGCGNLNSGLVSVMTSHSWTGNTLWWELNSHKVPCAMSLQDAGSSWTDGCCTCDSAASRFKPRQTTRHCFYVETHCHVGWMGLLLLFLLLLQLLSHCLSKTSKNEINVTYMFAGFSPGLSPLCSL